MAVLFLAGVMILSGSACTGKKKIVLTTGFEEGELFKIDKATCSVSEYMVYLTNMQNMYENTYGDQIWEMTTAEGEPLEDGLKETVLSRLSRVKVMNLLAEKKKVDLHAIKDFAVKSMASIDMDAVKEKAVMVSEAMGSKANEIKDSALAMKEDITEKLTELDRMLESSVTEYNDSFTLMNDKGVQLFIERNRSVDSIGFVENLVNSIANRPKSFDAEFEVIETNRAALHGQPAPPPGEWKVREG